MIFTSQKCIPPAATLGKQVMSRTCAVRYSALSQYIRAGGVRHDPQRFMGKTVYVPHFNRDTVEFASRERDGSKPGIKILLPVLKNITEESDLENF